MNTVIRCGSPFPFKLWKLGKCIDPGPVTNTNDSGSSGMAAPAGQGTPDSSKRGADTNAHCIRLDADK